MPNTDRNACLRALACAAALLAALPGRASESAATVTAAAVPARTYALVAAFPDAFSVIYETPMRERSTAYADRLTRRTLPAAPGTFNRLALSGLARSIVARDPGARLVYLGIDGAAPRRLAPGEREDFLLRHVVAELEKMPQRREWQRIVVALPAYRALDHDRLPARMEGFGIYLAPNCESDPHSCGTGFRPPAGPQVETPAGETVHANHFVAPYAYIAIVLLDPATLAVLDRERVLEHQKLYDPDNPSQDLARNVDTKVLAAKVIGVIGRTVENAIARTELAGKVEIKDIREVK